MAIVSAAATVSAAARAAEGAQAHRSATVSLLTATTAHDPDTETEKVMPRPM